MAIEITKTLAAFVGIAIFIVAILQWADFLSGIVS